MTQKSILFALGLVLAVSTVSAQVDTTYIYNNSMPYGTLDIRLASSVTAYYYLQDGKTFSFRANGGVPTNTYLDMTSWDSSPYQQGNLRFLNGSADNLVMNYRYLPPLSYNPAYQPGYPLVVILHGLGESANCNLTECYHADESWTPATNTPAASTDPASELLNNDHQLTNGGRAHLKAVNDAAGKLPNDPTLTSRAFPGFVLFPQNLNGWSPATAHDVIRMVRLFTKKYKIDPNRVYIHGLSNGGMGVYEVIKRAPWLFAATATMSPISDANIINQGVAGSIAHIPQWVFQGGQDQRPTPQKTESMIRKFRDAGASVRYTLYPDLGHSTWGSAYNEPDFFQWFLGKNKTQLHSFSGSATICAAEGLKLELPAGFFAYQWELNGQVINGATSNSYMATAPGNYRARFSRVANPSEANWNPWSAVVEVKAGQSLTQAEIIQKGTVVLRDLNNGNEALLRSGKKSDRYYWYRNGVRVDFPGDQDDTIRYATVSSTMGAGSYTLINANYDNCQSPASAAKQIFFSNSAPLNITSPSNFAATIAGGIEANLTWTDASNNEGNFEIWRRRKTGEASFTPWELVVLTAANATTYSDKGLLPTTTYEYKIRGVSSTGRSEYTPAASSLSVVTSTDTQKPTAPQNLTGSAIGVSKVRLKWKPATDNGTIKDYIVRYNADSVVTPTADTIFVLTTAPVNQKLNFVVRSRDQAGNISAASNSVEVSTYVSGLYYEHTMGATEDLDTAKFDKPEFTGKVAKVTLQPKRQEDYFNFLFDGFVFVTTAGGYQFRVGSDDGSRLAINENVVVENDGVHTFKKVESTPINLAAGSQRFTLWFFDYVQSDSVMVEYKGPDTNNEWRDIPADVFKSSEEVVTGVGPDNGPEDSFRVHVFPNPTRPDNLNIQVETISVLPVAIELIDGMGRSLVRDQIEVELARESFRISSPSSLRPGMYFIRVTQGSLTSRRRVIITQ